VVIDTSTLVLAVGELAAGGAGGYFASESGALKPSRGATEPQATRASASTLPTVSAIPARAGGPGRAGDDLEAGRQTIRR
jgi:hypothetical protein